MLAFPRIKIEPGWITESFAIKEWITKARRYGLHPSFHSLNCHSLRHIGQWAWEVCEFTHFKMQWRWNAWLQEPHTAESQRERHVTRKNKVKVLCFIMLHATCPKTVLSKCKKPYNEYRVACKSKSSDDRIHLLYLYIYIYLRNLFKEPYVPVRDGE